MIENSIISANKYAFLNGTEGLHDSDKELFDQWTVEGKNCIIVDNLFEQPSKIEEAVGCECWVLYTTGMKYELILKLFERFKSLNYLPTDIVLLLEHEVWIDMAKEYEGRIRFHGHFLGWGNKPATTYIIPYLN